MSRFLQRQRKALFSNKQNIFGVFFILRPECELCVYGQGGVEFEMITQISFGHN